MLTHARSLADRLRNVPLKAWVSLTYGPLVLTALVLIALWLNTLARIEQEQRIALDATLVENNNIAHIIAANLDEVLGRLRIYGDIVAAMAIGKKQNAFNFSPIAFGDPAYLRLAAFDARGSLIFSSARDPQENLLMALLEEARRKPGVPQSLIIGRPDVGSSDFWRVPVLLPPRNREEVALLGAHLDLGYFLKTYKHLSLGPTGRVEIIGDNGYRLIESSGNSIIPGGDISTTNLFAFIQTRREGAGVFPAAGQAFASIVAFVRLDRFPVSVVIERSYEEVMADNASRRARYLWETSLLSMLLVVAAVSLALLARKQQGYYAAAKRSEHEKHLLIEQLKDERNKAYRQASHDNLTGLPNRMHFFELASKMLAAAKRNRNLYSVLFIDLDRFKLINDTLGHNVGDLLLQEVANRLRACVRESDLVARFAGDEFMMLISVSSTIDDISQLAAKVVEAVGQPCQLEGNDLAIHASVGVSLYGRDGQEIELLVRRADAAMYEAKSAGRGKFKFFDASLNRLTQLHFELAQRLRQAINDGELSLHYQARVSLDDFRVVGLEALVRWLHPEHGLIYPDDFIPMAEQGGLILPLGSWVIDEACQQLATWRSQHIPLVPIAINVSPRQLQDEDLVSRILLALEKHSLPGYLLEVEITETCAIADPAVAALQLSALKESGIRAAMDDFGSGFSNLSLLRSLPIHAIKIDRSLISDIRNHHSDAIIVDSTITLAHNLGYRVVAEGVETREQVLHLKVAGCDEVQGYYFQRPAPADVVATILSLGSIEKS